MLFDQWKGDGNPDETFFKSTFVQSQLHLVKEWLQNHFKNRLPSENFSTKSLAALTIHLLEFQEQAFGTSSISPVMVKIPVNLFMDFSSGGALCCILLNAFQFKLDQGWRRFDLLTSSRTCRAVELFVQLVKALQSQGHWTPPRVFLSDELVPELQDQLADIVTGHQGSVVHDQSSATHVIHNASPSATTAHLFRPVIRQDKEVLLHKLSTPNSYDMWTAVATANVQSEQAAELTQYHVTADWLLKLQEYNEWMNEEDFLVDKKFGRRCYTAQELQVEERRGRKRRELPDSPISDKRYKSDEESLSEPDVEFVDEEADLTRHMDNPPAEPTIQEVTIPRTAAYSRSYKDLEYQPVKAGVLYDLDEESDSDEEPGELLHSLLPAHSAWFRADAIHSIERRSLPEFFNDSSAARTPRVYVAYRNCIIDTYRARRYRRLRFSSVRKQLPGDAYSVMRVFAFLEQWGLINYCCDEEPHSLLARYALLQQGVQGLQMLEASCEASEVDPLSQVFDVERLDSALLAAPPMSQQLGLPLDEYRPSHEGATPSRSGRGQVPSRSHLPTHREWSEQETLQLLEALELYRDDWNQICLRVPGRTQDECIMQFLRLPIDDAFRDGSLHPNGFRLHPDVQYEPFGEASNPVMATLVFLAATVDPRVAAAGASCALVEYARLREQAQLTAQGAIKAEKSDSTAIVSTSSDVVGENRRTADIALQGAVQKAKTILSDDAQRLQLLACRLVHTQMQKLNIKLRHLEELSGMMRTEKNRLVAQRADLRHKRAELHAQVLEERATAAEKEAAAALAAAGEIQLPAAIDAEVTLHDLDSVLESC